MLDATFTSAPDGSGFPGAAAVHDNDRRIVKTGIRVGTDGVGEVMIHEAERRLVGAESLGKPLRAAALVPHADEISRRIKEIQIGKRPAARGVKAEVMPVQLHRWAAILGRLRR